MDNFMVTNLLPIGTPLLAAVALMLLVPAALAPQSRLAGSVTLFGGLLLSAALMLLAARSGILTHFTLADGAIASVMLLTTGLTIAPLADRARPASLMLAAPIAAYATLSALVTFGASSTILLTGSVIASSLTALIGSALLPAHPARYTVTGQLRSMTTSQATSLIGWVLLALSFIALARLLGTTPDFTLVALSTIIAALATLLTTRAEDGLAKAGEAIAAAALLTLCATLNIQLAVMLGLLASFLTNRSEAISLSLRVDDPQHFIGALLLPAAFGLILPGILDTAHLAPSIVWLGIAIITGLALAALIWPLVMLLTGLALPKRRIIQGVCA